MAMSDVLSEAARQIELFLQDNDRGRLVHALAILNGDDD